MPRPESGPADVPPSAPSPGPSAPPSAVAQDYLKVVWTAREWDDAPVTTAVLAGRLGVALSTASEQVRRLAAQGWVASAPYRPVELTEAGTWQALRVVRRHRLLETYLVAELGYGWDEVHDEAEVLEHVVSEVFLERVDARLGRPHRDPHGDPIPAADGSLVRPTTRLLGDLAVGEGGLVARISDDDPVLLRDLERWGLVLDAEVGVVETPPGAPGGDEPGAPGAPSGRARLRVGGVVREVAPAALAAVRVTAAGPSRVS